MTRLGVTLVFALAFTAPHAGVAQEAPVREKDPALALVLELVVPVVGHAYAGDANLLAPTPDGRISAGVSLRPSR